ncbi:MAG: hypothetical protein V1907_04395 [Candidatus Kerfeldbacteria bacterium]
MVLSQRKVWEWVRRYGPQEGAALIGALIAAYILRPLILASGLPWSTVVTAYVVTFADALTYYIFAQVREYRRHRRDGVRKRVAFMLAFRDLAVEYGVADIVDTVITRPFCMYWAFRITSNPVFGVPLGMLGAGLVFYTMVIPGYELRKQLFDPSRNPGRER